MSLTVGYMHVRARQRTGNYRVWNLAGDNSVVERRTRDRKAAGSIAGRRG